MPNNGLSATHVVLGIHGGTGILKKEMSRELDGQLRAGLEQALHAGFEALQNPGASSLDAVEAAVRELEDCPLFNAGRGSVFTADGRNELDASIMEGEKFRAGAVAGVTILKNPVSAARAVMEKSPHVFLMGRGAELFASQQGLEIVDPSYFWTQHRWTELERTWKETQEKEQRFSSKTPHQWGTVGAVAVDKKGLLASATSTGGMTYKKYGRIGDSPVIGAGTYADNESGAVSATGHGEFFLRFAVAHDVLSLKKYKGVSISEAAETVINQKLKSAGGEGGLIALDPKGNFAMARNCEGLYRGYVTDDGQTHVFLFDT